MQKKHFPLILFLLAAILLVWIKFNQKKSDTPTERITIEATDQQPFNRSLNNIEYTRHAKCRMDCRQIDSVEVRDIINNGVIDHTRTQSNEKGISYAMEGNTDDGQEVRIVVAPKENKLVIVTVIDLGNEWKCNCN